MSGPWYGICPTCGTRRVNRNFCGNCDAAKIHWPVSLERIDGTVHQFCDTCGEDWPCPFVEDEDDTTDGAS